MLKLAKKYSKIALKELASTMDEGKEGDKGDRQTAGKGDVVDLEVLEEIEKVPDAISQPCSWTEDYYENVIEIPLPLPLFAAVGNRHDASVLTETSLEMEDTWRVVKKGFGHDRVTLSSTSNHVPVMKVRYVAGAVGSCSGFGFYGSPSWAFPTEAAGISYMVYFPTDFDWKKGGKLPGLYIGEPGATGGDWSKTSGSARVIFKEKGLAAAYIYVPCQVSSCGTKDGIIPAQHEEYEGICHATAKKGHHVWKKGGKAKFKAGEWNSVCIWVRLNTPGSKDGELLLEVNGVIQKYDKMVWRSDIGIKVGGINCVTFFGGSSPNAAAPQNAFTAFKDFRIYSL